jgi:hypothetical protein
MERKRFLFAAAGALVTACGNRSNESSRFEDIVSSGEPLKAAFNNEAGNVRILMLLSPT